MVALATSPVAMRLPLQLPTPPRALALAGATWFIAATIGQWAFVAFILGFFIPPLWTGDLLALNNKPHITGYVPGDLMGNTQLILHVLLGAAATAAGILQLIPAIRRKRPAIHRWNGRIFMVTALIATLNGFYLTWIRGSYLNIPSAISISINGMLIFAAVVWAWRAAISGDYSSHRRHALRAYLLVNGVWFLRIGMVLTGIVLAPMGYELSVHGGVFLSLSFLSWMLPLACLQLYFWGERTPHAVVQYGVAALFFGLAALTLSGSLAATLFLWWPRLSA